MLASCFMTVFNVKSHYTIRKPGGSRKKMAARQNYINLGKEHFTIARNG